MKKVVLLAFVLVLILVVVFVIFLRLAEKEPTIIYIRADGSIEGTRHIVTIDNVTYPFTDNNINIKRIVVEKDNILIDGAGYTLQGTGIGVGVSLYNRSNITVKNIRIKGFFHGISLGKSSKCNISENYINCEYYGLLLQSSTNNTISKNTITNNNYGISFFRSPNNSIIHNNFLENTRQVGFILIEYPYSNFWDDGYPSGGNYWSDYDGADSDGDSIGDTPYVINSENKDNHPLMDPLDLLEDKVLFWMQWWFWAIVTIGIIAIVATVYFLKRRKPTRPKLGKRRLIR